MTSPNILSYSQIEKWKFCQTAWKNHYILRYRPIKISSALLFGSAIGKTFEYILNFTQSFDQSPNDFFDELWEHQEINGISTELKNNPNISYFKSDLDEELLTTDELNEDKNWHSLRKKGHLIIESFLNNFLPLVEHVYSVEEKAELINEDGDSVVQYSDTVCKLKGYDMPIVLDFKTASRAYEQNSVAESIQLSGYMHLLSDKYKTRTAGYVVFLKKIEKNKTKTCTKCGHVVLGGNLKTCNKMIEVDAGHIGINDVRCHGEFKITIRPECKMQLIIDEIPEEIEDAVIEAMDRVNTEIKMAKEHNIFLANTNGCENNGFGAKCDFYDLCCKGDATQYIKLEKKDEN